MAIRLSGMVSGMDTESLVSALVSGYKTKKDNLVKAQTKIGWTQEKWKTMNTSIYGFYSGKLSSARFSTNYSLKTASVSDSKFAKVSADTKAVNGTQTLKVNKLATTGYLTGAEIKNADGSSIKGSDKISDIIGKDSASIGLTVNGKTKNISIDADTTISSFVGKLKDAGLNASFDEANKRFFISSKSSGADNDFSLTANDSNGLDMLKGLGLYTYNVKDQEEYSRLAALTEGSDDYNKELESMYSKVTAEGVAKSYADKYNNARTAVDNAKKSDLWTDSDTIDSVKARRDGLKSAFESKYASYYKEKLDSEGNPVLDSEGNAVYEYDMKAIEADGLKSDFESEKKVVAQYDSLIKTYEDNAKIMDDSVGFVSFDGDKAVADKTNTNVLSEVAQTNDAAKAQAKALLDSKIAMAATAASETTSIKGAKRVVGEDSEIELNGAVFKNNTNNYSINGLTIQALAVTGPDENISITTETDIDGIYNKIKDFLKDYNELIKSMDKAYNAASSKGYEPLTDEEKDAMSDKEVEKWEEKIKDSLLRKDQTLGSLSNLMKTDMLSSFKIGDKSYSLSSFGISTLGYFSSPENETGVFHIDGDKDDTSTAGKEDKLRSMIASDPDTVIDFFSQLSNKLYTDLGKKMTSSSTRSAYTVYNDKQMNTQYSEYNTKISTAEDLVTRWEDYYFKKFSSMESMLASINQQQSSLGGLLGR